jgi:hypothetical protein
METPRAFVESTRKIVIPKATHAKTKPDRKFFMRVAESVIAA